MDDVLGRMTRAATPLVVRPAWLRRGEAVRLLASLGLSKLWRMTIAQRDRDNKIEGVHLSCVLTHRFL
jgi:hypothetical protein